MGGARSYLLQCVCREEEGFTADLDQSCSPQAVMFRLPLKQVLLAAHCLSQERLSVELEEETEAVNM